MGTVDSQVEVDHPRIVGLEGCLLAYVGGLAAANMHHSNSTSIALLWSSDSAPIQTQDVDSEEQGHLLIDLVAGMRRVHGNSGSVHQSTHFHVGDWVAVCHSQVFRIQTRH